MPCVMVMVIALLVLCLPPESGERLTLGVIAFLAMCYYHLLLAELTPPTSQVIPIIGTCISGEAI